MALSGSVSSGKYDGRYYQVSWTATQNVSTNKSTITWKLYAKGGSDSWYAERTLKVVVAGKTVVDKTEREERYTGLIDSGTVTVTHSNDGTKSFSVSIKAAVYTSSVNCTGSKTFTLTTIARASSISSLTTSVTLGNACSVVFTPKSTSFYYKVKFAVGNWNVYQNIGRPATTSSYTYNKYTLPISVANQIANATSATMTVTLFTYSDSEYKTQIGSGSSKTTTVTVPTSIVPTMNSFNVSLVNTNTTIKNWGVAVAGYTKLKFTGSGSGSYGSTISSYVISGGLSKTVTSSSLSYESGIITSHGDLTFKALCKDTRSRSSSQLTSSTIKFYSYSSPVISSFKASRDADNPQKISVIANWSSSSVNNLNTVTAVVQYKKVSESSWKNADSVSKNTATTLSMDFDDSTSYNVRLSLKDSISTAVYSEVFIPTREVLLNFKEGGKGLGIGKICENDGLEVAFDASFEKNVDIMGNISAGNLGRNVYSGTDIIVDAGYLSSSETHSVRFYILKPFNLVYFRGYINGISSAISSSNDRFTMCTFDERFTPAYNTALSCYSANEIEALINTDCQLRVRARDNLSTGSIFYISGMYPLSSVSELYI